MERGGKRVSEWLFWLVLAILLAAGRLAGVGVFMGRFATSALASSAAAAFLTIELEQQLHLFLFAALVQTALPLLRSRIRGA